MLTLTLFRHAKSSWDFPELEDFDRPLAPRGRKAAPRMAAFLAEQALVPEHIVCSAARRTRETLDLALPAWDGPPRVDYAHAVYMADTNTLLAILHDIPDDARRAMIIGHNPGLESFALKLIGRGDKKMRYALASKFPTAAVAVIEFEATRWAEINPGSGRLVTFMAPKRLDGA